MEQRHKAEMKRMLDACIKARSLVDRAVFLFGHCNATEEMADYLLLHNVRPEAIFDNSQAKQGLTYREIPIIAPERFQVHTADNSVVLIATRFYAEMAAQLQRFGYDGEIVQVVEYDSFTEYSLSNVTIERRTARMLRGVESINRIRAQYPEQHLIVCPKNALGDVYWAMSFLPAYQEKHAVSEVVVAVIGNGCRQVAGLFGISNIIMLSDNEMDELVQAIIFTQESNCIIAHHDRPYTDNIIKWLDKHFLSFIDYYRCAVYGLQKETPPFAPTCFAQYENSERILKGGSVILSPYANSVVSIPEWFWENIASESSERGLRVFTNVAGSEVPVAGTEPLSIPISQLKAAAELAGTFIGIRNGLCDILYTADCKKTVVFPDCYYSSTPHKVEDFFALHGWESVTLKNNLQEVPYDTNRRISKGGFTF